ncbi:aminoglycoside phosphotransferase family protein [Saccharopolyspora indica]|uniref:aminoglycoside phosphotransferase family protein n=1 Tax=Saccharopolyspora indica TaxID=1229659 RepID=UPI0022EAACB8|nr:aminoglycoside phosphotransferase family protein [Saccharopolyspora indica]MDA3645475.1 hydroxyurea phosphotransferase [Saccharopolyspora indica]
MTGPAVVIPAEYAATHHDIFGDGPWLTDLPALAEQRLQAWDLRLDGEPRHGMVALVLPVLRADGTPAVLKLQPVTSDTSGEPLVLRAWDGRGAVRMLEHDPGSGSMLLERLGPALSSVDDDDAAVGVIAGLLTRLHAVPAPAGVRALGDIASAMVRETPQACARLEAGEAALLRRCADVVTDLLAEPGDRLLHWDLHYDNVLAGGREPWLAIDPQPLIGDPGFDLLPALDNRWEQMVATGDLPAALRRRFAILTDVLGLDRRRAVGWSLGRVLQNCLWDVEDGETRLNPVQTTIAETLLPLGP